MSGLTYDSAGLHWEPVPFKLEGFIPRLEKILAAWENTRYMSGQDCCGSHSDCIGFVFRVVDDLYRRPTPERSVLPPDSAMHNRESAIGTMRKLVKLYRPNERIDDGSIQPGDVIVVGPAGGGPSHVLIVGPQRNTLWHCIPSCGVCMTGIGLVQGQQQVFAVYRFTDREKWL